MRDFNTFPNTDNSNPAAYPDKRIKDNTGSGDGTAVSELVYGDIHQMILKAKRLYGIAPNNLPDNETNGFQMLDAFIALASKNDFILPITSVGSVLQVPVKIGFMKTGEQIVCKASVDKASETTIKGLDPSTFSVAFVGTFKSGEYVRLIKNASTITLVRLVDLTNLDTVTTEAGYLKKATQAESDAGTIDTKATTPLVDKVTFTKRVNGVDSDTYLATQSVNGLMSLEDKTKLDTFESNVKNIGWFTGLDAGGGTIGTVLTKSGNITSATIGDVDSPNGTTRVDVIVPNTLGGINYFVRMSIESVGVGGIPDSSIGSPVFRIVNATTFHIFVREFVGTVQNLKVHIETVKL